MECSPNENYSDLATIVNNDNSFSSYSKSAALAAYIDYKMAGAKGTFNTTAIK
jgi:dextranase